MTSPSSAPRSIDHDRLTILPFDGDEAEWDRFVRASPDGTHCHLSRWREVMADVLGHEPRYAVVADEEEGWCGVLPLVRVRSRLFGHYLVSMPFLNYGGPLGSSEAQTRLTDHAVEEARRLGADLLELRARHEVQGDYARSDRKITVVLELPDETEPLWKALSSKVRSQVRRPLKEGMETRFGLSELDAFYEVFARHMRDLGTPVLPRSLFERVAAVFREQVQFGAVYLRDRPVAAGCGFVWGDEFEMTWAASLVEQKRRAPNMLLYWSAMEWAIKKGLRHFNFGRCSPGGGTHRFKRQWGGVDVPLPWINWSSRGLSATPSPERPIYRLAAALWQRLPLSIASRLGPVLSRRIP